MHHRPLVARTRRTAALTLCVSLSSLAAACTFSSDQSGGFHFRIGANAWNLQHHASEERRLPLELRQGDTLVLDGVIGDVEVHASDRDPSELVCRLDSDGRTQEEAEAALDGVRIRIDRVGNEVRVSIDPTPREIEIDTGVTVELSPRAEVFATVPVGTALRIREATGEIEVTGPVAKVDANTAYGAIELAHVTGGIEATTGSGSIEIRNASGGDVVATTDFGDVRLESVEAGRLEARSSSGDLELRAIQATSIIVSSSFGSIELEGIEGDVSAETASGDIEIADVKGACRLHSDFGRIEGLRVAGKVQASSDSGSVEIESGTGSFEAESGFGAVRVHGVLRHVHAESDSGDVEVVALAGSTMESDWRITSQFGRVELRVSSDFAGKIDARTDFGKIDDEFDLSGKSEGGGAHASGAIGAGGRTVKLRTSSGDVSIGRN